MHSDTVSQSSNPNVIGSPVDQLDIPSDVTIRRSAFEDADGLQRCLDAVARERRHIAMVEGPTLEQVRAFLREARSRRIIQWVALSDSQVIGWCDLTPRPMEGFRHSATLGMGLLAAFRRRGLGSALLHSALREARSEQLSRIELEVYAANKPAIALYERFGFSREGIKRSARLLDGEPEDVLCMALLLPPLLPGDRS
jgi:RimJ/RimL family protein N-acetyltransferase